MKNKNVYIDMENTVPGNYVAIPFENGGLGEILTQCNGASSPIPYVDKLEFGGSNGLQFSDRAGYINLNVGKFYIEIDFSCAGFSEDSGDGFETLATISSQYASSPIVGIFVSPEYKTLTFYQYNTAWVTFASRFVRHDFAIDTTYNLKIIKTSPDSMSIYIDNELKYRTNTYFVGNVASPGTALSDYGNSFLRIGQKMSTSDAVNLIGNISTFRIIDFSDTTGFDGRSFETYSDNLLHHFKMDSYSRFAADIYDYKPFVDLGNNPSGATITAPLISDNPFVNLSDGELFWAKFTNSMPALKLSKNPIRDFQTSTIMFRMKTEDTLYSGTLMDCRDNVSNYNGFYLEFPPGDASKLRLRMSGSDSSWTIFTTSTFSFAPYTDYDIKIVNDSGHFMVYVDGTPIIDQVYVPGVDLIWQSNEIVFFNNVAGNNTSGRNFKDLRIYDCLITEEIAIEEDKIRSLSINNPTSYDVTVRENIRYAKDSGIGSSNYLLFVEGHSDYSIDLYKDNVLILKKFNNLVVDITEDKKHLYHYIIKETGVKKYLSNTMVQGRISISTVNVECEGTDLFARIQNFETGEFIGDYEIEDSNINVDYLDYNREYDVILIDRNKVIENLVRSKVRPYPV